MYKHIPYPDMHRIYVQLNKESKCKCIYRYIIQVNNNFKHRANIHTNKYKILFLKLHIRYLCQVNIHNLRLQYSSALTM